MALILKDGVLQSVKRSGPEVYDVCICMVYWTNTLVESECG